MSKLSEKKIATALNAWAEHCKAAEKYGRTARRLNDKERHLLGVFIEKRTTDLERTVSCRLADAGFSVGFGTGKRTCNNSHRRYKRVMLAKRLYE